jgi:hypothetical protein
VCPFLVSYLSVSRNLMRLSVQCATLMLGLVAMIALAGCSNPPAETMPGTMVKGKVTVSGKEPATYCLIKFQSVSNPTDSNSGSVDPTGRYSGRAPLGKCKVCLEVGGGGSPSGNSSSNPYGKGGAMSKGPTGPPPGAGGSGGGSSAPPLMKGAEIPKKFTDVKTSGIEVTVVEGQDLDIDFK